MQKTFYKFGTPVVSTREIRNNDGEVIEEGTKGYISRTDPEMVKRGLYGVIFDTKVEAFPIMVGPARDKLFSSVVIDESW